MTDRDTDDWGLVPSDDQFHAPRPTTPGGPRRSGSRGWSRSASCWATSPRVPGEHGHPVRRCAGRRRHRGGAVGAAGVRVELARAPHRAPDLLDTKNLHGGMWLRCLSAIASSPSAARTTTCPSTSPSRRCAGRCSHAGSRRSITVPHRPAGAGHGHLHPPRRRAAVDCIAMRDRSWGVPRRPAQGRLRPYRPPTAVSSPSRSTAAATTASVLGYLLRDGVWSHLADGQRTVERRRAPPGGSTSRRSTSWAARSARRATGEPLRVQRVPAHVLLDQPHGVGRRRHPLLG